MEQQKTAPSTVGLIFVDCSNGVHLPKVTKNRPGLATLRCTNCGKTSLLGYENVSALDDIQRYIKMFRGVLKGAARL